MVQEVRKLRLSVVVTVVSAGALQDVTPAPLIVIVPAVVTPVRTKVFNPVQLVSVSEVITGVSARLSVGKFGEFEKSTVLQAGTLSRSTMTSEASPVHTSDFNPGALWQWISVTFGLIAVKS